MGATTCWELSRRGCRVTLLERSRFAAESTGKSAAVVRMHYSNRVTVRMALKSRRDFIDLPQQINCQPCYERAGWLFIVDEASAADARKNRAMQVEEGSSSVEIDPGSVGEIVSGIQTDGIAYAIFEEESGFADPVAATLAYINAARRESATVREQVPVDKILVERNKVIGVVAGGERIECERVVLAAGAWSGKLAAAIGIELPLEITREQDVIYETNGGSRLRVALSDQVDRIYLRPFEYQNKNEILVGRGFPKGYEFVDPDGYEAGVDDDFELDLRTRVVGRLPELTGMRMAGSRVGLYTVTPDWHPILGNVESLEGLCLATGGSGHCFKLGPAIGEMVAGAVLGFAVPYADVELFGLERFERGSTFAATLGGNRA
jgi:sarcosine oxidase subunit beta